VIELFRHEAMNQATVIAGFCEIIENQLLKQSGSVSQEFLTVLHKVEKLIGSFNQTFAVFREESMEVEAQGSKRQVAFGEDITSLLSPACRTHFGVLREIAAGLSVVADSIGGEGIGSSIIASRYVFVQEAASRLCTLFTDPANFIQKAFVIERSTT
jgi:hypothetical protein